MNRYSIFVYGLVMRLPVPCATRSRLYSWLTLGRHTTSGHVGYVFYGVDPVVRGGLRVARASCCLRCLGGTVTFTTEDFD